MSNLAIERHLLRLALLGQREELLNQQRKALLPQVPIDDAVSDEDVKRLRAGVYVEDERERIRQPFRQRELITITEAAWVLGHADSQSLRRCFRDGKYPQRKHYQLPWSIENHHLVFVQRAGSNRIFVNHHVWSRYLLSLLQLERLEMIEHETFG